MNGTPKARVWMRAVVGPAVRRVAAVWTGCAIVGAVLFGPTGIQPRDVTGLAWHVPAVGLVLGATWVLLFVPAARLVVRADGARYLRSLPGARASIAAIAAAAIVGLQLPWIVLWSFDPARGIAMVFVTTALALAIAAWPVHTRRSRRTAWPGPRRALAAIYTRGLVRRGGHALVRGAGLSVLAGIAGGLIVRNNAVVDADAAVLGAVTIEVVRVPAAVGILLPLVEAHRASTWLARSVGHSDPRRLGVLALVIAGCQLVLAAIAAGAAAVTIATAPGLGTAGATIAATPGMGTRASTIAWVASTTLVLALCSGIASARAIVWAEHATSTAARLVVGTIVLAAITVLALGLFGIAGVGAVIATAVLAIGTVKP